ncbi:MAG: GNAT family N-acetyltransferase [Pyrinomonadaceae bacterium]|nr:GNAT family N-acetyltransferase [Pyrinomonadaceae bacterium]
MLETERILIRPFTLADLPLLIEQRSDPEVNQYLGGATMQNAEALAERIKFYIDCHEKYGFGMSAMIWKETGEIFGWSGLQPLDWTTEIEVGYGMIKKFWGRGIGFEAAQAWLNFGFNEKKLQRIVAVAYPENTGSRRIMEKLGLKYEKTETHYGAECVFYGIASEEFAKIKS